MHKDLRLDSLNWAPPSIRRAASAACSAGRSSQDVARFLVAGSDIPEGHLLLLLPVYYVLLDPAGIPAMEQLDPPSATTQIWIRQAFDLLRDVYALEVPIHLGPDLFPRVYKWTVWFHTYRDHLPGPPLDEASFCIDFMMFAANFHTDDGAAQFICATPGLNFMIARAWSFILDKEAKDWRELTLAQLWCFIADMAPSNPSNFEEIISGVGGSLDDLASIALRCMDHILQTRESPVSGRTVYFLRIILDFLTEAENVSGPDPAAYTHLGPFFSALVNRDAVRVLSLAACALGESNEEASAYTLDKCFTILGRILISENGREQMAAAIKHGLLRAIVSCVHVTEAVRRHLALFLALLPPSLVHYQVVSECEGALRDVEALATTEAFRASAIYEHWQRFITLARRRLVTLRALKSPDYVPFKTCDNLECNKINPKTDFKRCSGCLSFYYCSRLCQATDWTAGGHRRACTSSGSISLAGQQNWTARERQFIRATVHDDYGGAKGDIYAKQAALLRRVPGSALFVMFDYSAGPVCITVHSAVSAASEFPFLLDDEWKDSIARANRSGGRMTLHVVKIRVGHTGLPLLVPLRKNHSDVDHLLAQIAACHDDVRLPKFTAKFQSQFEAANESLEETH